MAGNPAMMVDPWGLRPFAIFVAGFRGGFSHGGFGIGLLAPIFEQVKNPYNATFPSYTREVSPWSLSTLTEAQFKRREPWLSTPVNRTDVNDYWGNTDNKFLEALGAESDQAIYLYGGSYGQSTADDRRRLGRIAGWSIVNQISEGEIDITRDDWLVVVSHSMGDAYAAGMIDVLAEFQYKVHTLYSIAPFQHDNVPLNPELQRNVTLWSPLDLLSPFSGRPNNQATEFENYRIPENRLPTSNPHSVTAQSWGYGGHKHEMHHWYFDKRWDRGGIVPFSSLVPTSATGDTKRLGTPLAPGGD